MKIVIFIILLAGTVFANPYTDLKSYTLPNGLQVYLLPNHKSKNVYVDLEVGVGMAAESKKKAGISHLTEHLVFRDRRVKYHDYYDMIKEKGATYVNGYTSDYKTQFVAKMAPEHAYWLTHAFYNMLFDKNITNEDLKVEKKALQLEIGEPDWTDYFPTGIFKKIGDFISDIDPDLEYDLYKHDFKIDRKKGEFDRYNASVYKRNNKRFTLQDVMEHYQAYYYPSNMTLKIVGNFDLDRMEALIAETFGSQKRRKGKSIQEPLFKDAVLSHKPYIVRGMPGGTSQSSVSLGYKFIDNNMTQYMIVESYFENLADRLNRELRNKKGDTYSVYGESTTVHNAGLGYLSFSTHHDVFEKNMKIAKEMLLKESRGDINDTVIRKALENSLKYYDTVSTDVMSLMYIVDNAIAQKRYYGKAYRNPYEIIRQVTPEDFRSTLKHLFIPEHFYMRSVKDYFLFPYEGPIILFSIILITILLLRKYAPRVNPREIRLKRRVSNILFGIVLMIVAMIIAGVVSDWIEYGIIKMLGLDMMRIKYLGNPLDYLYLFLDFLLFLAIYIVVFRILFGWYYAKLFVTKEELVLFGGGIKRIPFESVDTLDVVSWRPSMFREIYGNALLFFKKLLKVTTKDGKHFYVRAWNAQHLKEDIESFLQDKGNV